MDAADRIDVVRRAYAAYERRDREALEALIPARFTFFSGPDPGIDRAAYFERCWPGAEHLRRFEFLRLRDVGDEEVLVTYEAERTDGSRFRNTELFAFEGEELRRVEVYFGWDL